MKNITTTLLISTYNWPEALSLVLKSIENQTVLPNEVIIADDGSAKKTKNLINEFQKKFPVPLIHEWHEDLGFRKTIILNRSIKKATGEYIIQIDGDIILHPKFIADHIRFAKRGFFVKGSRGRLMVKRTEKLFNNNVITFNSFETGIKSTLNTIRFPLFTPLLFGDKINTRNIKGCNFAFWKNDAIAVNGYNNEISGWGHEDIEFPARMVNYGIKKRQLKFAAVCYHIYYPILPRDNEKDNYSTYENVINNKISRCKDGIDQV